MAEGSHSIVHHVPRGQLSSHVDLIWYCEGPRQPQLERVLPNGSLQLVINLRQDPIRVYDRASPSDFTSFEGCVLSGAHSKYVVLDRSSQVSLLGVHFKPGGAFPFLGGVPACELHNLHIPYEAIHGRIAVELLDRQLVAGSLSERIRILERLLEELLSDDRRHPAVLHALEEFDRFPHKRVTVVAEDTGLSSRRFIEVFKNQVGLTPKLYCRVRRFQEALRLVPSGKPPDWAGLAQACGYHDQAHMIHDFREFGGITPTTYMLLHKEYRNHIPLAVE